MKKEKYILVFGHYDSEPDDGGLFPRVWIRTTKSLKVRDRIMSEMINSKAGWIYLAGYKGFEYKKYKP